VALSSLKNTRTSSPLKRRDKRLNCRIDKGLLDWAHWYAAQRRTTVTQLVINHFQDLKVRYEDSGLSEVDQL
jgi:predicted HicB family RNase H-like nuclease